MPAISDLTHSPLGVFVGAGAKQLKLYNYGRKPFIFFATGIALTTCLLSLALAIPSIGGPNPTKPEWRASLGELNTQVTDIYAKLIFAGSFVLGVSQAVKKKQSLTDPDLTYVFLYGKLVVFLLAVEFICNLLLQPTASGKSLIKLSDKSIVGALLSWLRQLAGGTARNLASGASQGFAYGYLIRGVGVLFQKY